MFLILGNYCTIRYLAKIKMSFNSDNSVVIGCGKVMEMSCQVKGFSNFVSESECISGEWEPSSMLQAGMSAINGESAILYNSFT